MKNLLYISCHSTLEEYDTTIFDNLGFNVFSTGFYQNPTAPTHAHLNPLKRQVDQELLAEFKNSNPNYTYGYHTPLVLTKEFVNKFDIIVISWRYDYLNNNWDLFKDKIVLFETVGQSDGNREKQLSEYRKKGVKLIRVSATEEAFPCYAGADFIAGACIDTDRFYGWTGENPTILSINSAIMDRPRECNTTLYLKLTEGLNKKLYGTKNDKLHKSWNKGVVSSSQLVKEYQRCRLYFSLGSKPAPLTYTAMEAMSIGCPVITWGPKLGSFPGLNTYITYKFINNEVNGFYSDDLNQLRFYIETLLKDHELAKKISIESRKTAIENFAISVVQNRWEKFLSSLI